MTQKTGEKVKSTTNRDSFRVETTKYRNRLTKASKKNNKQYYLEIFSIRLNNNNNRKFDSETDATTHSLVNASMSPVTSSILLPVVSGTVFFFFSTKKPTCLQLGKISLLKEALVFFSTSLLPTKYWGFYLSDTMERCWSSATLLK